LITFIPLSAAEKRRVRPRNFPPPPQFPPLNSAAAFYTAPPLPPPRPPPRFTNYQLETRFAVFFFSLNAKI